LSDLPVHDFLKHGKKVKLKIWNFNPIQICWRDETMCSHHFRWRELW